MAPAARSGPLVELQVTFAVPEHVLSWAIAQASRQKGRDVDHVIAILVSAHREARVVSVKLPERGETQDDSARAGGSSEDGVT